MAREVGASDEPKDFDEAFDKVIHHSDQKKLSGLTISQSAMTTTIPIRAAQGDRAHTAHLIAHGPLPRSRARPGRPLVAIAP
jgi:hypothetical protein